MRIRFLASDLLLIFFLGCQISFWYYSKPIKPNLDIVPRVPGEQAVKALALGDEQFYFRALGFQIQNAGDTFGRFTAFKDYDYHKLFLWFKLLDTLDPNSNFIPSLASYYYSLTQNTKDAIYIVDYLEKHAERDLAHKWWWMYQATYIANHKLHDQKRALELAYKLASTTDPNVPIWVKQFPAFILSQMDADEEAMAIIRQLLQSEKTLDQGEKNFMNYFINTHLEKIEKRMKEQGKVPVNSKPSPNEKLK